VGEADVDAVQQREQNKKRKYMNTDATTTVRLSGLTCHACQKLVTTYLKNIHGVKDAIVDLETGMTTITADRAIPVSEVERALQNTAYRVEK